MPKLADRVRSVRAELKDANVSTVDLACAAGVVVAMPGIVWAIIAHWGDLMAYIASL